MPFLPVPTVFTNYKLNHLCKVIHTLVKDSSEISLFLEHFNEYKESIVLSTPSAIESIAISREYDNSTTYIICLTDTKIRINNMGDGTRNGLNPVYGNEVLSAFVYSVPNSDIKYLHIITDASVFMYRGKISIESCKYGM